LSKWLLKRIDEESEWDAPEEGIDVVVYTIDGTLSDEALKYGPEAVLEEARDTFTVDLKEVIGRSRVRVPGSMGVLAVRLEIRGSSISGDAKITLLSKEGLGLTGALRKEFDFRARAWFKYDGKVTIRRFAESNYRRGEVAKELKKIDKLKSGTTTDYRKVDKSTGISRMGFTVVERNMRGRK